MASGESENLQGAGEPDSSPSGPGRLRVIAKYRGLLLAPPVLFMAVCTWRETELKWLAFGVGGALFAAGLAVRIWAQMNLHHRLHIQKVLTVTGPYRRVRNPIYLGNVAMLIGACFMSELLWFAPIMLAYAGVHYSLVVRHEESRLRQRYGAPYEQYLDQVPRWFPRHPVLSDQAAPQLRGLFWPSFLAEVHNLLLLIPFLVKEFIYH